MCRVVVQCPLSIRFCHHTHRCSTEPAILADVTEGPILKGWSRALEILQEYSSFGPSVERLATTLRLMFEAVPQQYSRFKAGSRKAQTDVLSMSHDQNQGITPLSYWRLMDPVDSLSVSLHDIAKDNQEDALPDDWLTEFETTFDPGDLSWLTTIPLDPD